MSGAKGQRGRCRRGFGISRCRYFEMSMFIVPLCHFRLLRRRVTSFRDLHKPMAAPVRFPRTLSSLKCSALSIVHCSFPPSPSVSH